MYNIYNVPSITGVSGLFQPMFWTVELWREIVSLKYYALDIYQSKLCVH